MVESPLSRLGYVGVAERSLPTDLMDTHHSNAKKFEIWKENKRSYDFHPLNSQIQPWVMESVHDDQFFGGWGLQPIIYI